VEDVFYNKYSTKTHNFSLLKQNSVNFNDHERYTSNSLTNFRNISAISEQKSINTDKIIDNDTEDEDELCENLHFQTYSNSSIGYDKSTLMSNKTYVNLSINKSNCNMNSSNDRKVLGEIGNILNSRKKILIKEDKKYSNKNKSIGIISSSINNYQISTSESKIFPDSFDRTLTPKISDVKKLYNFDYNDFFENDNDPFNSKIEDIDVFNNFDEEQDQEQIKFKPFFSDELNYDKYISNNDEDLGKNTKKNVNLFNSIEFNQKNYPKNTILTSDALGSLSSTTTSTSLSSLSDISFGIKKVDLDIRFTEDNQKRAERIANMSPSSFFGMKSAPLGCLDGESLTPSQRPLYKYFTPESETSENYSLLDSLSESDCNDDFIDKRSENSNIFENINELSNFENENKPIISIKNNRDEKEMKIHNINNSFKQKINCQTLILISAVLEQNYFERHKYYINFGDVKIFTRKRWNIILQCDIIKIINWQLTQEKTLLEKRFMKDSSEFIQNHTLDIDAFTTNYTYGKIDPDREETIILTFFPTSEGKYYKKISFNIGKHKILFNIEGNGISSKTMNINNDRKTNKQNNKLDDITVSNSNVEGKELNQELPITFESVNNNLYNITFIDKEKKLLFESTLKEKIICLNIKRLLYNKAYSLKINNTSNQTVKIYFDNTTNNKNTNNFYVKFPEIIFNIPSQKCCFIPFKLFFNANSNNGHFSFYTIISCNNISKKILISYKKPNFKSGVY